MKKIAFFIYNIYESGGTEKAISLIANKLSEKYDVKIFSLYQTAKKPFFELNDKVKVINILQKELPNFKIRIPYLRYMIKRALKLHEIDTLICTGTKYVPITIATKKKTKYIAWEHYSSYGTVVGSVTWLGRKLACKKADKVIVLTNDDKDNYIKLFKASPSKLIQIFNPIEYISENTIYNEKSKSIISCGRLLQIKGFDMLLDVAKIVFEKHSDWHWDIYGEGTEREKLQKKINEYHLENNVTLKGNVSNMNEKYKDYSFFVLTSRSEGLSFVLNEAHGNHLPIVSFDCPYGPRNIVKNDVNGFLIKCFNIDAMAEKINYLIENADVRKQMSKNSNVDKDKFKIDNIMNEWEKII